MPVQHTVLREGGPAAGGSAKQGPAPQGPVPLPLNTRLHPSVAAAVPPIDIQTNTIFMTWI